jgi:ribose/xylose/arabinose/galactoside ABC-type transport system permease subunit
MRSVLNVLKKLLIAIAIPMILYMIVYLLAPDKIGLNIIFPLLQQAILPAILAWGVTFELKLGIWDFSVGAVVLFASILGGQLSMMLGLGVVGVIVMCSLCGIIIGLLTGTLFNLLKIPSIIVSTGMMLILESVCAVIFDGQGVNMPASVLVIGKFPLNIILGLIIFGLAYFLYNYVKFGYHIRAVGNGIGIAKLQGINIAKVRLLGFMVTGLFAGFYAFMSLGTTGVAKSVTNMQTMGVVFDAIICVFVALALEKTTNLIIGVYIGSIAMQLIKLGILAIGFPGLFQQVVIAFFLLLCMSISSKGDSIKKVMTKVFKTSKVLNS